MNDVNACYYSTEQQASFVLPFLQLYDAGRVQRFHTVPSYETGPRQNLADHSWGVAMLCRELCRLLWIPCSSSLLIAALTHDLSEYWTCDMPAHVKWEHPALRDPLNAAQARVEGALGISDVLLSDPEKEVLKLADGLELYVYCRQRARAGAMHYAAVAENIEGYLRKNQGTLTTSIGLSFLNELKEALK